MAKNKTLKVVQFGDTDNMEKIKQFNAQLREKIKSAKSVGRINQLVLQSDITVQNASKGLKNTALKEFEVTLNAAESRIAVIRKKSVAKT